MSDGIEWVAAGLERLAATLTDKETLPADWLPEFHAAPRHRFVPTLIWAGRAQDERHDHAIHRLEDHDGWQDAVWSDIPITTQWDDGAHVGCGPGNVPTCSNSMPSMVFTMLGDLDLQRGQQVLEIGTGTGWTAALMSHRAGADAVTSVETDPDVHARARNTLEGMRLSPHLVCGDGADGHPGGAPYERVLATCSVGKLPYAWVEQCKAGGLIVAPWGPAYGGEAIVRLTVGADGTASGRFTRSAAFMRLRQQRPRLPHVRAYMGRDWPADGVRSSTGLSPEDVGDWLPMFAIGMQVADAIPWAEHYDDGTYTLWLRDTAVTSWATVDFEPDRREFEVVQGGERRLWDEVETAYRWWQKQDSPTFTDFGLTVESDGQRPWLHSPANPLTGG